MRCVGVLLTIAALLATPGRRTSDQGPLSGCIKRLLLNSRDKVCSKVDPLRLKDHHDGDLEATSIVVRGLAAYDVDDLSVTFPHEQQIAVRATISWPTIFDDLNAKLRKCTRNTCMQCVGVLLTIAALLAATGRRTSDQGALSGCIKRLLLNSRDKVCSKVDPLRLKDHHDGDLEATSIVVRGMSAYDVDYLAVTFPRKHQIAVRATISWPTIIGDLNVKLRKRIMFVFYATVRARPHVTIGRTYGMLTTLLTVSVNWYGQLSVSASGTDVNLNLSSIHINPNVQDFAGAVNRLFGDPASSIASKLANRWCRNSMGKVKQKACDALDKALRENFPMHLMELLRLFGVGLIKISLKT